MTYLDRELTRIRNAMPEASPQRRRELYVALQALSWASDPTYFRSPYDVILNPCPGPGCGPSRPDPRVCECHAGGL
ncbi:hypothetical protein GCM10007874_09810 [Labrys miyagiensis]|uniref:Uncharacterized protein n=1 Tax=Labrys miyagiensis TaxID=346912 RepID=A0ABQ6CGJ6_9HYPH|nr:hypothetical protein [Labrys miyagiensis]GLS17965.1 hypothetical protein GCM10007874_09810 [Labrys miyagiensis]